MQLYEDLITAGDRDAIWRFYVFENNIIEEDPTKLLDPKTIDEGDFAEAQCDHAATTNSLTPSLDSSLLPAPLLRR